MKCTQCGSTKFIERTFLTSAKELDEKEKAGGYNIFSGRARKVDDTAQVLGYQLVITGQWVEGGFRIIGNCNAYICEECGHIELFAKSFVEKVHEKQRIDEENAKRKLAVEAQLEKDYVELNEFVKQLKTQLGKLEKLSNSEYITVKEQKEVLLKLQFAKRYLPICENLIASWNGDCLGSQKMWLNIKAAKQKIF